MTTTIVKKPEWIEKLPNGWVFLPVRAVLRERKEKNTELEESNILSVMKGVGVIRYEDKGNVGNKSSERPEAYKIVRANDLVLNSMNLSIGSVGMAHEDGVTSSVYIIYQARPKVADPNFYHYLFQTTSFQRHLASYGRGIMELREAVKERDIKNQPIVVPPLETQKQIADFLDEKTKIIDELVAKKEKLVELLREKRAALITHAVTKGLNRSAKLKPSGIDWLDDIPEPWIVRKIKQLSIVKRGASPRPIDDPIYFDEDGKYSWVRIEDVTRSGMYLQATKQKLSDLGSSLSVKLKPNQIFISIAGSVGKPCITKIKCCIHDGFVYFPLIKFNNEFLYYIFESGEAYKGLGKLGTQLNLNTFTVGEIKVPIPPNDQAEKIVAHLKKETAKIDKADTLIKSQIEKLKEYRSSLVYYAVTGKIKV